jgi:hypothetical protein
MSRFAKGYFVILIGVMALAFAALEMRSTEAHGGLLSPYTYNAEIFPILRDKCGRCHVEGGPAPMSLVVHVGENGNGAQAWARGIRDLIISEQMPPWYVDPMGPAIRGGNPVSAREADRLITWAIGKAPLGDAAKKPAPVEFRAQWRGGAPDLKIAMDSDHTLPVGTNEETRDFVLSTGLTEARWVKAVDLLPGAATIVRNAVVSIENGAVLAVWVPGDDLVAAPSGAAFRLPAGAKLRLQIHYKKQWQLEGQAVTDRSTVGLYFTDAPASGREIQSLAVDGPNGGSGESKAFTNTLTGHARVVAVRPSLDQVYGSMTVQAVTPTGTKVPLLSLRLPRPEWRRRYWLAEPVELPAGSRIEVSVTPPPPNIDLTGARLIKGYPLQAAIDFVPQS